MLTPRLVFWYKGHLWFVITDPLPAKGKVVCVNFTTYHSALKDGECILKKAHYDWIKKPTAVAFSRAELFDVEKIRDAIRDGNVDIGNPSHLPPGTFTMIRKAAQKSVHLDPDLKRLL